MAGLIPVASDIGRDDADRSRSVPDSVRFARAADEDARRESLRLQTGVPTDPAKGRRLQIFLCEPISVVTCAATERDRPSRS